MVISFAIATTLLFFLLQCLLLRALQLVTESKYRFLVDGVVGAFSHVALAEFLVHLQTGGLEITITSCCC